MAFQLPALPYAENALEPHVSARTLQFHHGKHHKKYVDTLNQLVNGTELDNKPLEEVIRAAARDPAKSKIFNNAAQTWNHTFFWQCMAPNGGQPSGALKQHLERDFGSLDKFNQEFAKAAEAQFGSGWAWLIEDGGTLKIMTTHDADLPLAHGKKALLTCDVWEHAYYLDYQNDRAKFVQVFLAKLANWAFAEQQFEREGGYIFTGTERPTASEVPMGAHKDRGDKAKRALAGGDSEEVRYAQGAKSSAGDSGVEGEGSYSASRDYQRGVERTMKSGKIEERAQEAKRAVEGAEGDELRRAERRGQQAAKMEDPALGSKKKPQRKS